MVKQMITAVVLAAACALGAAGGAAPAAAATRPVVVYEPALFGLHAVKGVVRPSSWYLTIGPATQFRGTHWSSWGRTAAAGTATMYQIEAHARPDTSASAGLTAPTGTPVTRATRCGDGVEKTRRRQRER